MQEQRHHNLVYVSSEARECSAADSSNPLQQPGILQCVLDHVGPGHWSFLAEVCSLWKDLYLRVASKQVQVTKHSEKITCVPQMTSFSAVFASPARVRLAQALGLRYDTPQSQRAAGMHAGIATLAAAHELGMQYTHEAMLGAAHCNEVAVVQFLHARGCTFDTQVSCAAAARGHTNMCAYLHAEQCPWGTMNCTLAAIFGHSSTLRWLREHGCPWDAARIHLAAAEGGSVDALTYVQQQGIVLTNAMLTAMLSITGALSKLAAAKWLRAQGAE
jgi:hypothetical protein